MKSFPWNIGSWVSHAAWGVTEFFLLLFNFTVLIVLDVVFGLLPPIVPLVLPFISVSSRRILATASSAIYSAVVFQPTCLFHRHMYIVVYQSFLEYMVKTCVPWIWSGSCISRIVCILCNYWQPRIHHLHMHSTPWNSNKPMLFTSLYYN